jgi:threonine synthase
VLTATSGDTGGAVAHGFYKAEGIDVVILYPSGKVSEVQELQLTTLGHNIHALEVNGTFDDCQRLVKQAFADEELNKQLMLTSANSINVARWLPQQFYYCFAWQQWPHKDKPPVISVPSGNFGNLCAGVLAALSGLTVQHFIAACNANDVVPRYLQTGEYKARQSIQTLSNAMDVGDPSNFVRLLQLFGSEFREMGKVISAESISDEETVAAIKDVYNKHGYVMDPHGAVGYVALERYLGKYVGSKGIFLETAHAVKFDDVTGRLVDVPSIKNLRGKEMHVIKSDAVYEEIKQYLFDRDAG